MNVIKNEPYYVSFDFEENENKWIGMIVINPVIVYRFEYQNGLFQMKTSYYTQEIDENLKKQTKELELYLYMLEYIRTNNNFSVTPTAFEPYGINIVRFKMNQYPATFSIAYEKSKIFVFYGKLNHFDVEKSDHLHEIFGKEKTNLILNKLAIELTPNERNLTEAKTAVV